jgi:hypothetical protein
LRFNGFSVGSLTLLLVSIAAAAGGDNDKPKFEVKPAAAYPRHQTSEKVTVAAQAMETDEETRDAFGKVNPYRYGVLPVLLVIQNDGPDAIRVERMKLEYMLPDGAHVEATPAQDVKFLDGIRQPKTINGPVGVKIRREPKNPLAEWEIEGRAFAARMIPAGQSASGFIYFQVSKPSAAAAVYVSGIENAVSGKELYYFEIPMSGN